MSVLDREALEASPLADLHAIASELSIDGFRRLRREALISAILARQAGEELPDPELQSEPEPEPEAESEPGAESQSDGAADPEREGGRVRRRRGRTRVRGARREGGDGDRDASETRQSASEEAPASAAAAGRPAEDEEVEGVVELLPNGSGFVRVDPPEPSDADVYISAAQIRRCELVSGDRVSGPRRAPRRSERFASLVRIDTINGSPADEVASSPRFDELPAAFPQERFRLGSEDPTVKAIEWLTPIGRGSRVTIVGEPGAGKTEALRRLAQAFTAQEGVELSLALAGVRPEEIAEWEAGELKPGAAVSMAGPADAQDHAVEMVVDQARRMAARGAHAVVLVDGLDGLHPQAARKALAAARNIVDGGSLTVIATAARPLGGETTVIALDRTLAVTGRFPALDLVGSGTVRPELLVGDAGAEAIARARADALES